MSGLQKIINFSDYIAVSSLSSENQRSLSIGSQGKEYSLNAVPPTFFILLPGGIPPPRTPMARQVGHGFFPSCACAHVHARMSKLIHPPLSPAVFYRKTVWKRSGGVCGEGGKVRVCLLKTLWVLPPGAHQPTVWCRVHGPVIGDPCLNGLLCYPQESKLLLFRYGGIQQGLAPPASWDEIQILIKVMTKNR